MNKEKQRKIRKWLNSYRILKKTIQLKEKHLEDFISIMYNPLKETNTKVVKTKDKEQETSLLIMQKMEKIYLEIITDLETDIVEMKKSIQEIFNVINGLNNYERSICFNRYILGCTWNEVATGLGYEVRQCQRYDLSAIRNIAIYFDTHHINCDNY